MGLGGWAIDLAVRPTHTGPVSESGSLRWLSAGVLPADELEVKRRQFGKYITPIKITFRKLKGQKY